MNTETPPPRPVPDRPSDAAIAQAFRELRNPSGFWIYPSSASELVSQIRNRAAAIDAAAPPAEAPARAIRALYLAVGLDPDKPNHDALLAKVCNLAKPIAAPAAPAEEVYSAVPLSEALRIEAALASGGLAERLGKMADDAERLENPLDGIGGAYVTPTEAAPRVTGGREAQRCAACDGSRVLPHDGSECPFCDAVLQSATGGEG